MRFSRRRKQGEATIPQPEVVEKQLNEVQPQQTVEMPAPVDAAPASTRPAEIIEEKAAKVKKKKL